MFFSLWIVQCIGAGYKSNIYVENSVYATAATQKKPWDCKTSGSYKDYNSTQCQNGFFLWRHRIS